MSGPKRDLVGIEPMSRADIELTLDTAGSFAEISERPVKKVPTLRGKTVVNLFLEPSTRTRTSFEIAGKRLSADVINISGSGSSIAKGESLRDTLRTIEAMSVDCLVIRHSSSGSAAFAADLLSFPVINAGDGCHEHPTQALLDLYTISTALGRLKGVRVVLVGDVLHSRVARSLMLALEKVGSAVTVVAPPGLIPSDVEQYGVRVAPVLDDVLPSADVLYVLRVQKERMGRQFYPSDREYASLYGINKTRLEALPKKSLLMHPGPVNRGVEIDADVAESGRSLIDKQVTSGVAVRMASLYWLLGGTPAA